MELVHSGGQVFVAPDMLWDRIRNIAGTVGKVLAPVSTFIPALRPIAMGANVIGGIGGGAEQPQQQQPSAAQNLMGYLGAGQMLTGGNLLGQGQPSAPTYQLDPRASALMDQLTERFSADLGAPGGMTSLDNQMLDRLRHSTFGESLGADAQRLYEQQTMRGIEGSHPAFQAHEAMTRDADNRYWDSELSLRRAARDRQFDLRDMSMGLMGLGQQSAARQYDSAYDAWQNQQQNWQQQQQAWSQLAAPTLGRIGL